MDETNGYKGYNGHSGGHYTIPIALLACFCSATHRTTDGLTKVKLVQLHKLLRISGVLQKDSKRNVLQITGVGW